MQLNLNPRPARTVTGTTTITELLNEGSLFVGDRVVAIGLYNKVHGIGKVAAIRPVKGVNLAAVKFDSGHFDEFTELQLRKVLV